MRNMTVVVLTLLSLFALGIPAAQAAPARAPSPAPTQAVRSALAELSATAGAEVRATISPRSGRVSFLRTAPGSPIPVHGSTAEQRARSFLGEQAGLFGFRSVDDLITLRVSPVDKAGMEHVRFLQTYRGVPVAGGEIGVHLRGDGVVAVHSKTLPDLAGLSTVPTLSADAARSLARESLKRTVDAGVTRPVALSTPRLEILNRGHLGGPSSATRLAWFIEARRIDLREYLWVDAQSGLVLLQFSQLTSALDRAIYDADDPNDGVYNDLPGALVRSEGGSVTGDTDADLAYDYSGDTYDYYSTVHGRDSFDDAGSTIISTVHFCPSASAQDCPFQNAFWNGEQMVYGDGFSAADDVDAHELTHAVTERTANLFYYMQPGALNESYSDIFGETIDLTNGAGTDTSGVRWLLGEDVPVFGAIRDMMTPTDFGDPGKVSDSEYRCNDPGTDSGNVHTNSGVPNHAYALMVDGGTYNSVTVTGIGLTKAAKVEYRALTQYLLSASDFEDNENALLQSCSDLVGTDGIVATDCDEVAAALSAVEMSAPSPCGNPAVPDLCPAGDQNTDLFFDDFEELAGGDVNNPALLSQWTSDVFSGGNHWNVCCIGAYATSGTGNAWGYDVNATADSALEMVSDIAVPFGGAYFEFDHSYGFENSGVVRYWDGGVLEMSTDGGTTWSDAGGLIVGGASYGGTISTLDSNPLAGRSGFVADSYGYTASRLDLSSLRGQSVRFRFRIGTDSTGSDYGWFIDDARIFTCAAPECTTPDLVITSGTVTGVDTRSACNSVAAGGTFGVAGTGDLTLDAPVVVLTSGFSVQDGGKLVIKTQ